MAKILVTGCAGFIGYHTCKLLLENGHDITGIDTINGGYDPRLKVWRLNELQKNNKMKFASIDITDNYSMTRFMSSAEYDSIIHLAAKAGVRDSLKNPWLYESTNVRGTLNILEICRKNNIKKLVMASTSSLYGNSIERYHRSSETDEVFPQTPYSASKLGAEANCYAYHHMYGLDVTIPRYFTVYGEAGRPDMSIFMFIEQIKRGLEVTVNGDGSQFRDFTYIDDIAKGTVACMAPTGSGYEVINLGNNNPVMLSYMLRLIETELSMKANIVYSPLPRADVLFSCADNSKAMKLLGWKPKTSIKEGIRRTVQWHLTHPATYDLPTQ